MALPIADLGHHGVTGRFGSHWDGCDPAPYETVAAAFERPSGATWGLAGPDGRPRIAAEVFLEDPDAVIAFAIKDVRIGPNDVPPRKQIGG